MSDDKIIRLNHAAMDTTPDNHVIFRGVVDPQSLMDLLADDYQREAQRPSSLKKLLADMRSGKSPPDIELGTRGENFVQVDPTTVDLYNPTYIVDGLQRVTIGRYMLIQGDDMSLIHIGATVYVNTSNEWERERFKILNTERTRVSSNVLLHNLIPEYPVVKLLHQMTSGTRGDFVMQGRVQWGQNIKEQELISAHTLFKVLAALMSHQGASKAGKVEPLAVGLQRVYDRVGQNVFRDNVRTFFENIVDHCWSIRTIQKKDPISFIKLTFLEQLATMMSNHMDFWDTRRPNRLFVNVVDLKKLRLFPVSDNHVCNLASSGGTSRTVLYQLMVEHMNKSRRSGFLTPRIVEFLDKAVQDEDEDGDETSKDEDALAAGLDPQDLEAAMPHLVAT